MSKDNNKIKIVLPSMPFKFNSLNHTHYMRKPLKEAELALQAGEYAIGAVIVHNGVIIGQL